MLLSFAEGVMVAERDLFMPKHPELTTVPNLHVIKALQVSLNYYKVHLAH